ncbi:MAG: FKBP-type peptidyl-prolyl cis-trans isomerase [Candidatus Pacearchaeota archaeon]
MEIAKKKDFVEIKFTGYANGSIFDSNIEEDLRKIDSKAKPKKTIIIVGEGMVVPGLDNALEGKEIGKEYEIKISAKDGFGERKRELVKTIPLKVFNEKNVNPAPGMVLAMDNSLVRIIAVSGARVVSDFNNPLAGKELVYKFKIERIVRDEKEKASALFELIFKFVPDFELKENAIVVKGPKILEKFVDNFKDKFKEFLGKELKFEFVEKKPENKKEKEEAEFEKKE